MKDLILGENISVNLEKLIESRLLVQANSGAGKSYALRKLLEETHGKVQQIVLDMEGEFSTLREKYDYILAGKDGDVPADPQTAEILAKKVLEMNVSIIVDLYELKKHERILFVKNFVDALVNSPKEMWHPVLVVIDEAHIFVPEKGESAAANAVIDLATRGRKRGFSLVLATQRLSSMSKDVAAQCLNKLIGRTSLDIDRKRAVDELGFMNQKDSLSLRMLQPGKFYSYGPAINGGTTVELGSIGKVETTHLKAGDRLGFRKTKPTEHIREVLKKLTDLPKEAKQELHDKESMMKRIRDLEREVKTKPVQISKKQLREAYQRRVDHRQKKFIRIREEIRKSIANLQNVLSRVPEIEPEITDTGINVLLPATIVKPWSPAILPAKSHDIDAKKVGQCERKILSFLHLRPGEFFSRTQVAAMTGYRQSGSFSNSVSSLFQQGLILKNGSSLALNPDADVSHLVTEQPHRLEDWISKLGACEKKIYETLLQNPDHIIHREAMAEKTGYSLSGSFSNAISRLNTLGLIKKHGNGIQLNPEVVSL